jgi:hypothetical protein
MNGVINNQLSTFFKVTLELNAISSAEHVFFKYK